MKGSIRFNDLGRSGRQVIDATPTLWVGYIGGSFGVWLKPTARFPSEPCNGAAAQPAVRAVLERIDREPEASMARALLMEASR